MQAYEDSPDTTFIGLTLAQGLPADPRALHAQLHHPEQMGKLTFNDLDIRLLPSGCGKSEIALVTGKFHLERTAKGEAKKDDGIFLARLAQRPSRLEDHPRPHQLNRCGTFANSLACGRSGSHTGGLVASIKQRFLRGNAAGVFCV